MTNSDSTSFQPQDLCVQIQYATSELNQSVLHYYEIALRK
jgi:hypothetical protein